MTVLRNQFAKLGVLTIAFFALWGCEEKKAPPKEMAPKAEEHPILDQNLDKAIAATSAAAPQAARPANAEGPPEHGVFSTGIADTVHPTGKPIHIELGLAGTQPLIDLKPTLDDIPKTLGFQVATMMGARSSLPTVDMTFALKAEKPKGEKEEGPFAIPVTAKLNKIVLSSEQPGQVPKEVELEVSKMKNSKAAWTFEPTGGISNELVERDEKARPELEHNLVAVMETLASASLAVPTTPVGVGATWVARSRDVYGGLDIVSYRMIRITKVEEKEVTYQVETRQYAAGPKLKKPGLPEGTLVHFESTGTGEFVLHQGKRLAERGNLTLTMKFGLRPADAQEDQVLPMILQSTIRFPN